MLFSNKSISIDPQYRLLVYRVNFSGKSPMILFINDNRNNENIWDYSAKSVSDNNKGIYGIPDYYIENGCDYYFRQLLPIVDDNTFEVLLLEADKRSIVSQTHVEVSVSQANILAVFSKYEFLEYSRTANMPTMEQCFQDSAKVAGYFKHTIQYEEYRALFELSMNNMVCNINTIGNGALFGFDTNTFDVKQIMATWTK